MDARVNPQTMTHSGVSALLSDSAMRLFVQIRTRVLFHIAMSRMAASASSTKEDVHSETSHGIAQIRSVPVMFKIYSAAKYENSTNISYVKHCI